MCVNGCCRRRAALGKSRRREVAAAAPLPDVPTGAPQQHRRWADEQPECESSYAVCVCGSSNAVCGFADGPARKKGRLFGASLSAREHDAR